MSKDGAPPGYWTSLRFPDKNSPDKYGAGPTTPAEVQAINMRRFREKAGMTLQVAAIRFGISMDGLSKIERGVRGLPKLAALQAMVAAYGQTTDNLTLENPPPSRPPPPEPIRLSIPTPAGTPRPLIDESQMALDTLAREIQISMETGKRGPMLAAFHARSEEGHRSAAAESEKAKKVKARK